MAQLHLRGLSQEAACAFLDSCPPLLLEVRVWAVGRAAPRHELPWLKHTTKCDCMQQRPLVFNGAASCISALPRLSILRTQVYTASRFDCPGEFEARLVLDARSGPVPAAHFERAWAVKCGCCCCPSGFAMRVVHAVSIGATHASCHSILPPHPIHLPAVDAWIGGAAALASTGARSAVVCEWRRQVLRLAGYPPGVRRAVVLLRGTERRFWSGHYGAKFAAPALRFLPPGLPLHGS